MKLTILLAYLAGLLGAVVALWAAGLVLWQVGRLLLWLVIEAAGSP